MSGGKSYVQHLRAGNKIKPEKLMPPTAKPPQKYLKNGFGAGTIFRPNDSMEETIKRAEQRESSYWRDVRGSNKRERMTTSEI